MPTCEHQGANNQLHLHILHLVGRERRMLCHISRYHPPSRTTYRTVQLF
ncbi:hypothetical protein FOPG_19134 [Fusarium oxysporum f. sp. conglutinans race 2 54008]|uniref:Uncharacterized protein n=1 Tax=Fusarium oxysporum f. sp. conglutinans race 2 54008 TaxID=1089457 RepID=X0GXH0_FUSOX|nr:hypothetical protein FOPG_19134 [Fusarium oxysporum f. sp. conglutinans race 2 54008]